VEANVAVLEMTAEDARQLALAEELGNISLALRGVEVETVGMQSARNRGSMGQGSEAVRIHAYGTLQGNR
jgi:Flp pilus assembly protein CpaB